VDAEVRDLVEGAADAFVRSRGRGFASPFANAGPGLGYINSDVSLYCTALPEEWIGFEVVNHHATDGVAIGECFLYDQQARSDIHRRRAGATQADAQPAPLPNCHAPRKGHPVSESARNESSVTATGSSASRR